MDLGNPIRSVIPSAHGAVLAVLARTEEPLSGRRVAELSDGAVGQWRANEILRDLADAGVVLREHHPPTKLYRLNREHVAAPGILALAQLWVSLVGRIRDEIAAWPLAPHAACLFGSAARGTADHGSDIDLLLVSDDPGSKNGGDGHASGLMWEAQVDQLVDHVRRWSGNPCEVLELTRSELRHAAATDDRLVEDLRRDAVTLNGPDIRILLRAQVSP